MKALITFLIFNFGILLGGGSLYLTMQGTFLEQSLTMSQGITTFLISLVSLPLLFAAVCLEDNCNYRERSPFNRIWFKFLALTLGLLTVLLPLGGVVFLVFNSSVSVLQVLFALWFMLLGVGDFLLSLGLANRW